MPPCLPPSTVHSCPLLQPHHILSAQTFLAILLHLPSPCLHLLQTLSPCPGPQAEEGQGRRLSTRPPALGWFSWCPRKPSPHLLTRASWVTALSREPRGLCSSSSGGRGPCPRAGTRLRDPSLTGSPHFSLVEEVGAGVGEGTVSSGPGPGSPVLTFFPLPPPLESLGPGPHRDLGGTPSVVCPGSLGPPGLQHWVQDAAQGLGGRQGCHRPALQGFRAPQRGELLRSRGEAPADVSARI